MIAAMNPIELAIESAGSVGKLADLLTVRQSVVSNWKARGQVPAERVLDVERLTGVSRYVLRPDVFGQAPEAAEGQVA